MVISYMMLGEVKESFPEQPKEAPQEAFGYIYVTFEPISGKFYIGKQAKTKWQEYYYGGGTYPRQWKKDKLHMEHWIIQWCFSKEELNQAEYTWIDKYKEHPDIANLTAGGAGGWGGGVAKHISEELTHLFSILNRGENNPFYGKHHTEETKQKISAHNREYYKTHDNYYLGKHLTEEAKNKLSQKAITRWANEEMREKYIKSLKNYYKIHGSSFLGQKHTEETKETLSQKKAKLYKKERVEYTPNDAEIARSLKYGIKIQCVETGEVFNSIKEAGRAYGTNSPSHISDACRGKRRTALGYHWRYYNEEEESI